MMPAYVAVLAALFAAGFVGALIITLRRSNARVRRAIAHEDRDRRIAALERELGFTGPSRIPSNWRRLMPSEEPGPTELLVTRVDGARFAIGDRANPHL